MKSATPVIHPSAGLSCVQFPTLEVFELLVSKEQKKCNNTKIKYWETFYDFDTSQSSLMAICLIKNYLMNYNMSYVIYLFL